MVLSIITHLATLISDAGILCFEIAFDPERTVCTCKFSAVMQKNHRSSVAPGNWMSSKKSSKLNCIVHEDFGIAEKGVVLPILTTNYQVENV